MLRSLHVKNLALIKEIEIEFSKGLNILSGETGAGKSIIIGSINLALGEKVQKELLRDNDEPSIVELIFEVNDQRIEKILKEMDIVLEDDLLILSRKIINGRGVAKINAETVPASVMKSVATLLIDIHGQHEHQSLLSKRKHLDILDDYAKDKTQSLKIKLAELYQEYKRIRNELSTSRMDEEQRARELSFLEYEYEEIENANLLPGEDIKLELDYQKFLNGKKIVESLDHAYSYTKGDIEGASDLTSRALKEVNSVEDYDSEIKKLSQSLLEIDNLLNDFNRDISDYLQEFEFDETDFLKLENRLDEINRLKAKYGKEIEIILENQEEKNKRILQLRDYDSYLEHLEKQLKSSEELLNKLSEELSDIRKKYAKELTKKVKQSLIDLNFLDVKFEMEFTKTKEYTANGFDEAEFLISTNPGEPLKPLGKVASGGELSRIMLALKAVLANNDEIGTLIFDEIDTGISGRTAQMVSEKMNVIGQEHQVICITHLPQIAAMADSHFLIEKSIKEKSTISTIRRLNLDESIMELGRMIGGVKITDIVLESAREMKELAVNMKENG